MHQLLVLAEVALAFVLLVGAGLLIRSFVALMEVHPGYDPEEVLTFQLALPAARYPESAQQKDYLGELLSRLAGLPPVRSVGMSTDLPFAGGALFTAPMPMGGRAPSTAEEILQQSTQYRPVSDGFFQAMGINVLQGRAFVSRDDGNVIVVNESLVRREFPDEDPIGQEFTLLGQPRRVVGVVADVRMRLELQPTPGAYLPYREFEGPVNLSRTVFAVHVSGTPLDLVTSIRHLVASIDPAVPIFDIATMEERRFDSVARPRFYTVMLGSLPSSP